MGGICLPIASIPFHSLDFGDQQRSSSSNGGGGGGGGERERERREMEEALQVYTQRCTGQRKMKILKKLKKSKTIIRLCVDMSKWDLPRT
jgi:hypothetical protein